MASTIALTAASSVMSAMCTIALPPAASTSSAAFSASSRDERALITTDAPSRANASAMPLPSRRTPPVTIATLPSSGRSVAN